MSKAFDSVASEYEKIHDRSLPPGVESAQFFEQKLEFVTRQLRARHSAARPARLLDYGCSVGRFLVRLAALTEVRSLAGVDESRESLKLAQAALAESGSPTSAEFHASIHEVAAQPGNGFDIACVFNVLHHVPRAQRASEARALVDRLEAGARLTVWEHNPWNPLTRLLVRLCPFDEGVELLRMREAIALFEGAGLRVESREFINVLPPSLQRWPILGAIERGLRALPIGAQYRVVFVKPEGAPLSVEGAR